MTIATMLEQGTIEQIGSFDNLSFPGVNLDDIVELILPGDDDLALVVTGVEASEGSSVVHYRAAELDDTADLSLDEIAQHIDGPSLEMVGSTTDRDGRNLRLGALRRGQRAVFWAEESGRETQTRITEPVEEITVYRRRAS